MCDEATATDGSRSYHYASVIGLANMSSHSVKLDSTAEESLNDSDSLGAWEPCTMVSHAARFDPITGEPTSGSEPLGDWMPCTMGEIYRMQCDVPISVVWEPGVYGRFREDKALERCTGSWVNTYHVRVRTNS